MKKTFFLTAIICTCLISAAQNSEEEKIKKVVLAETEAFYNRNLEAWRATWMHDPKISRSIIANNYHRHQSGWDSATVQMERFMKTNTKPQAVTVENKNYNIVQQGNMAWVYYDQLLKPTDTSMPQPEPSREYRVLVKENDDWKIVAQVTTFPESFDLTKPSALENNLNDMGYALLDAKKPEDAIEIFKMNAKLNPTSWNAYDSLADAYERTGNKKLAIENYEKSVKLNPKNEHGTHALAKLKMK